MGAYQIFTVVWNFVDAFDAFSIEKNFIKLAMLKLFSVLRIQDIEKIIDLENFYGRKLDKTNFQYKSYFEMREDKNNKENGVTRTQIIVMCLQ